MKKYLLLLALVCLLGNRVLAQTKSAAYTTITHEVIDFTGFNPSWGSPTPNSQINWGQNDYSNYIESFSQQGLTTRSFYSSIDEGQHRISVSSKGNGQNTGWNISLEDNHIP